MSTDPDARLRRLLSSPESSGDAEERGLRRALGSLPAAGRPRHRVRALTLALAATIAVMTIAAGALAAAGALHVSLGRTSNRSTHATASRLVLQPGMSGIAAVIDGRLWLTTKGGTRIEGLPVASAELSPHALYVGAGIGHTLVVMAPNGKRAWAHTTRGDVTAIAWAPNGLLIAYVVHVGGGFQLRMIEGDGDHDRLVDPSVRPVRPSWRADGLALAYVGAGGHAVVYDLAHRSRTVAAVAEGSTGVAYAPDGGALAIMSRHRLWVAARAQRPLLVATERGTLSSIAWTRWSLAAAVNRPGGRGFVRLVPRHGALVMQGLGTGSPILALAGAGDAVAVAVGGPRPKLRILTSAPSGSGTPSSEHVLLGLPAGAHVSYFVTR
jgi:hypothetical protein